MRSGKNGRVEDWKGANVPTGMSFRDHRLQPSIRVDALRPRRRVEMIYVYHLGKIKLPEKRPWLPSVAGESGRLHRAGP